MTKKMATQFFRSENTKALNRKNKEEIRQLWNEFVDSLEKEGLITNNQASVWVNPFLNQNDR